MTSHEAVIASYVIDEPDELYSGIQVACECGAILLEEDDDELLPFSEVADAVRAHQENASES